MCVCVWGGGGYFSFSKLSNRKCQKQCQTGSPSECLYLFVFICSNRPCLSHRRCQPPQLCGRSPDVQTFKGAFHFHYHYIIKLAAKANRMMTICFPLICYITADSCFIEMLNSIVSSPKHIGLHIHLYPYTH